MKTIETTPSVSTGSRLTNELEGLDYAKSTDEEIRFLCLSSDAWYLYPGEDQQELRFKYVTEKMLDASIRS